MQQERRAREQQKLAAALARPEDHDMTDSDDEWNIEEKKIMLGMESSSHVADEGYRSVEKLIERISGVQNGAANRLSSLILEIDAMLQGGSRCIECNLKYTWEFIVKPYRFSLKKTDVNVGAIILQKTMIKPNVNHRLKLKNSNYKAKINK